MSGTAYCIKCKEKRDFDNGTEKVTKNGRRMLQGTCKVCGTKVSVFLKSNKPKDLTDVKVTVKKPKKLKKIKTKLKSVKNRTKTPMPKKTKSIKSTKSSESDSPISSDEESE
jgi:hypothetical protein